MTDTPVKQATDWRQEHLADTYSVSDHSKPAVKPAIGGFFILTSVGVILALLASTDRGFLGWAVAVVVCGIMFGFIAIGALIDERAAETQRLILKLDIQNHPFEG